MIFRGGYVARSWSRRSLAIGYIALGCLLRGSGFGYVARSCLYLNRYGKEYREH